MANEITTAGASIGYCVETTPGTMPTTGFTNIPNVKAIGEFNPEPNTLDVTDLADTVWKRYTKGLKDPGGAIALTCNITNAFATAWDTLVQAYETGISSNKAMWFEVTIPGLTDKFYFAGIPQELGMPGVSVDSVYEGDVYITPNQIHGWD